MALIDSQLMLHDASALCSVLLLRPGRLDDSEDTAIVGEGVDRQGLLIHLEPALNFAWPEHPREPADLADFLDKASDKFEEKAEAISGEEDFVPAALVPRFQRDLVFEHIKLELVDVLGGVETEDLWGSFDAIEATAAIKHLTEAGLRVKMRSLGSFLMGPANRFDDEIAAAEFFSAGRWKHLRDEDRCDAVASEMRIVNKLVAHLTLSRPLPEDREIYRSASSRPSLERLVQVFAEFTEYVDERLLPDWWRPWFDRYRAEVDRHQPLS